MSKVIVLDLPFHRRTRSNRFFVDLLRAFGASVSEFFWEPRDGLAPVRAALEGADVAVLWQSEVLAPACAMAGVPSVAMPMWDAVANHSDDYWAFLSVAEFACFSLKLHLRLAGLGLTSVHHQYFPPAAEHPQTFADGLRGFLWERRAVEALDWPTVHHHFGSYLTSLHVHQAPDPGYPASALPEDRGRLTYQVTTSKWRRNSSGYRGALHAANVYFAPRRAEGIGMSFLEAMAQGCCVVAFDTTTHNEYIADGITGLLLPEDLDDWDGAHALRRAQELGEGAWYAIADGRTRWEDEGAATLAEQVLAATLTPSTIAYDWAALERILDAWERPSEFRRLVSEAVAGASLLSGHRMRLDGGDRSLAFLDVSAATGGTTSDLGVKVVAGTTASFVLRRPPLAPDLGTFAILRLDAQRISSTCVIRWGETYVRREPSTRQSLLVLRPNSTPEAPWTLTVEAADADLDVTDLVVTTVQEAPRAIVADLDLGPASDGFDHAAREGFLQWLVSNSVDPYADTDVVETRRRFNSWVINSHLDGDLMPAALLDRVGAESWADASGEVTLPRGVSARTTRVFDIVTERRRNIDPVFADTFPLGDPRVIGWYYLHGIAEHRLGWLLGAEERAYLAESEAPGQACRLARIVAEWRQEDESGINLMEIASDHPGLTLLGFG